MHQPIRENLEEYLSGMEDAGIVHEIEAHLASCEQCRRVMEQMRRQSELLKVLHPRTETEPAPGFYARVIDRIEALRPVSVWSIFLEPGFSRKIAYASLALLVLMGTLAISVDRQEDLSPSSPEVILAEELPVSPFGVDQEHDREVVLVNLATYEF